MSASKKTYVTSLSVSRAYVEHAQHHRGCGSDTVLGVGSTPREALADALESLAQGEDVLLCEPPTAEESFGADADRYLAEEEIATQDRQPVYGLRHSSVTGCHPIIGGPSGNAPTYTSRADAKLGLEAYLAALEARGFELDRDSGGWSAEVLEPEDCAMVPEEVGRVWIANDEAETEEENERAREESELHVYVELDVERCEPADYDSEGLPSEEDLERLPALRARALELEETRHRDWLARGLSYNPGAPTWESFSPAERFQRADLQRSELAERIRGILCTSEESESPTFAPVTLAHLDTLAPGIRLELEAWQTERARAASQDRFAAAFKRGTEGLEAFSAGSSCPGCSECGLAESDLPLEGARTAGSTHPLRVYDGGSGSLFAYVESFGILGVVRADSWEEAYEIVVDEIMDDADPTDPDTYARAYDETAEEGELAEGCHHRSGTPTDARFTSPIAREDLNFSALVPIVVDPRDPERGTFTLGAHPAVELELYRGDLEERSALASEASFSWSECDVCGSSLGGDRHPAHYWQTGDAAPTHLQVCVDCLQFSANGDLPEDWQG